MNSLIIDEIIINALKEDGAYDDITSNSIIKKSSSCTVDLISKEDGIIAGTEVFKRVFELLGGVEVEFFISDGQKMKNGEVIAKITGSTYNVLSGERTALNLLQRMSGIATITSKSICYI